MTLQFMAKLAPKGSRANHWWVANGFFPREATFYSKVLPRMMEQYEGDQVRFQMYIKVHVCH